MLLRLNHTRPWSTFELKKLASWLMMNDAKHKSLTRTAAIFVSLNCKLGAFNRWMQFFGRTSSGDPHHVKSVAHIQSFLYFPRNCPPTPTGVLSRDSSGDKRHLHVSCLTPRREGSASRWILTDLHRAKTPYQYPVLVSSRVAHCSRGQYGQRQRKTPQDFGWSVTFGRRQTQALWKREFPPKGKRTSSSTPQPKTYGVLTLFLTPAATPTAR